MSATSRRTTSPPPQLSSSRAPRRMWLTLLVILSTCTITMLAVGGMLVVEERSMLRLQYQRLYQQWLVDYRASIEEVLSARAVKSMNAVLAADHSESGLGAVAARDGFIRRAFVASRPAQGGPAELSQGEVRDPSNGRAYRWIPSFSDDGLHLSFVSDIGTRRVGFEAERARVLAEIVATIYRQPPRNNVTSSQSFVVLVDEHGTEVARRTQPLTKGSFEAIAMVPLAFPLTSFQLHYVVPRGIWDRPFYGTAFFIVVPAILLVVVILVPSAAFFYREHRKEMILSEERVRFVNQVSHELRTPLTNILMYSEMVAQELEELQPELSGHLRVVTSESSRLDRLLVSLLTFARHERGTLRIVRRPERLAGLVEATLTQFHLLFEDRNLSIDYSSEDDSTALVDRDALVQILGNLLSNVVKYAPPGSCVRVRLFRSGGTAYIRVTDQGRGVPSEFHERIFEPFFRVEDSVPGAARSGRPGSRPEGGTGIGLSISRELARLHGGDLRLESQEHGASFLCSLHAPIVPDSDPPFTKEVRGSTTLDKGNDHEGADLRR